MLLISIIIINNRVVAACICIHELERKHNPIGEKMIIKTQWNNRNLMRSPKSNYLKNDVCRMSPAINNNRSPGIIVENILMQFPPERGLLSALASLYIIQKNHIHPVNLNV